VRASPNVAASALVDGSRSPSWTWPDAIASTSARATRSGRGPVRPDSSSVKLTGAAVRITHPLASAVRYQAAITART
jgi:hypothetical protein